jgi:hypothetical protein
MCFCLLLFAGVCAWAQDESGSTDTSTADVATDPTAETPLQVPPPVSTEPYSSEFAGEERSNFLRGGFTIMSAYSSNVFGSNSSAPVADMSYSIWPTLALDKTTTQLHLLVDYSPGFTFYQHTSAYNQSDQNLGVNLQYRFSPNVTLSVQESFQQLSNVLNQPNPLSSTTVSGSLPNQNVVVIAPIADQLNNSTNAQVTYQVGPESMVGVNGTFGQLYYPNPDQVSGLYNSRSESGSAFYSRRLSDKYYVGGTYQFQNILSYQTGSPNTQTQTQTIFMFFTMYLKPSLSLSVSGGPQHYLATQSPLPASAAWTPMLMASLGWQGERTNFAVSYAHFVSGGGGLSGAFHSDSGNASAGWQINRIWNAGLAASYASYQTLTPLFVLSNPGGHTLSGTASLQRTLGDHLKVQFGYSWIHQNYAGVPTVASNPNINRAFVSITYQFTKALQR